MRPAPHQPFRPRPLPAGAFTLIELILVMTILVVVIGILTPKLKEFFAGRALDSEVRRFVSLTRYGRERAVSEGVPMILWINAKQGTYGLRQETGYTDRDIKLDEFRVDKDLSITLAKGTVTSAVGSAAAGAAGRAATALPGIHFSPDGFVQKATSVSAISIQQNPRQFVWIVPTADFLGYEVQSQNANSPNQRR